MAKDFSSMSEDEKRGYLKALGVDPSKLGEDPPEKEAKDRTALEERTISVKKKKFSRGGECFSGRNQQKFGGPSV